MTKRTKQNVKYEQGSVIPAIPMDFAKRDFTNIASKSLGNTATIQKFLMAIDAAIATRQSFTIEDIMYYCAPYKLENSDVVELLKRWSEYMERIGKVTIIQGCYNQPIIQIV